MSYMHKHFFYFSFYYSWCDVLQDFINLINVDVDVEEYFFYNVLQFSCYKNE